MHKLNLSFRLAFVLPCLFTSPALAATADLPSVGLRLADSDGSGPRGLRVVAVQKDSTAFVAGFQPGDLITAVDGAPRLSSQVLSAWVLRYFRVGEQLGITWKYVKDGSLSDLPLETALMIGRSSDQPWLVEVEEGEDAGRPFRDIRFHERFTWPNRPPAAGVAELIAAAGSSFSGMFEAAKARAVELPCDGERYKALDEMGKDLVIAYYMAHGMINDVYTGILTKDSDAACTAKAAQNNTKKACGPTPAEYAKKNYGNVIYSLMSGCFRALSYEEQLFVAGYGQMLLDKCPPSDAASKKTLERFLSPASFAAIVGNQYSNPNLGEGLVNSIQSSTSYTAGAAAFKQIGCEASMTANLAERIAEYLEWAGSGRGLGASRFVEECVLYYEGRYDREQCQCFADVGRALRPDIHQGAFSSVILQSLVKSNPFVGMQLMSRCGLTEY